MLMTQDQVNDRAVRCPNTMGADRGASSLFCVGIGCFAWRWYTKGDPEVRATEKPNRFLGYCGLAGKPEFPYQEPGGGK